MESGDVDLLLTLDNGRETPGKAEEQIRLNWNKKQIASYFTEASLA